MKAPTVKTEALELPPMPLKPPPPQPGSEDWVYVNEPIPEVWWLRVILFYAILSLVPSDKSHYHL